MEIAFVTTTVTGTITSEAISVMFGGPTPLSNPAVFLLSVGVSRTRLSILIDTVHRCAPTTPVVKQLITFMGTETVTLTTAS